MASSSTSRDQDLAFLIVQFLEEHNFTESARMLEKECKIYFNMKYVEEAVTNGKWKELEDYILCFTKIDENQYSFRMIFEIRKQKYIEALDNGQHANALEILKNELKMFAACNQDLFTEITKLLTLNNIRENEKFARYYIDTKSARRAVFDNLKIMTEMNPVLMDKLKYPTLKDSRLKILMNQSINWQHKMCKYPELNPTISTLFVDHTCGDPVVLSLSDGDRRTIAALTPCNTDERELSIIPEINEQSQLCSLRLPDPMLSLTIGRLTYSNSGGAILALPSSGMHKLWKWERADNNVTGKATPSVVPKLWQFSSETMTNDIRPEDHEVVPCLALSKNDAYVVSALGGKMSLFNLQPFRTMATFVPPPPAATSVIFYPEDNNIIIIGMEDGSIRIYDVRTDEIIAKIHAHQKRVTGLAYSSALYILVSSGSDAQICAWSKIGWVKQSSKFLDNKGLHVSSGNSSVKFHPDQKHLLVVHQSRIATLEGPNLQHCKQWIPGELIGDAAYSCDGHSIYTSFVNGQIVVLDSASFTLRCLINPSAYLPLNPSSLVYPCVLATHPTKPNQFALGLRDGGVQILEPAEGDWPGSMPQLENVAGRWLQRRNFVECQNLRA